MLVGKCGFLAEFPGVIKNLVAVTPTGETSTSSVEPLGPDFAETPSFNWREFVSIRG